MGTVGTIKNIIVVQGMATGPGAASPLQLPGSRTGPDPGLQEGVDASKETLLLRG